MRDPRHADDVLAQVVDEHAGPHFLHALRGQRAEDARRCRRSGRSSDSLSNVNGVPGRPANAAVLARRTSCPRAAPPPRASTRGRRRRRWSSRRRRAPVSRRRPRRSRGCCRRSGPLPKYFHVRSLVVTVSRRAVRVRDDELREQRLPVAEVVPDGAEAEQAAPPALAEHRAHGVVAGLDQAGDVVGLIQVRDVVLRQPGIVVVVADARAVQEHLVDAARRDVEARRRDAPWRGVLNVVRSIGAALRLGSRTTNTPLAAARQRRSARRRPTSPALAVTASA